MPEKGVVDDGFYPFVQSGVEIPLNYISNRKFISIVMKKIHISSVNDLVCFYIGYMSNSFSLTLSCENVIRASMLS